MKIGTLRHKRKKYVCTLLKPSPKKGELVLISQNDRPLGKHITVVQLGKTKMGKKKKKLPVYFVLPEPKLEEIGKMLEEIK